MAKYHIRKDGRPGICRAKEGNCPLEATSEHFDSLEEAQEYADSENEKKEKQRLWQEQFDMAVENGDTEYANQLIWEFEHMRNLGQV